MGESIGASAVLTVMTADAGGTFPRVDVDDHRPADGGTSTAAEALGDSRRDKHHN
ncbi:MAG: hypothetical protein R3C29_03090 [Dehalococcoidia bacterium]